MATEVRYKLGTTLIGTGTVAPDYAFNWTNALAGSHEITAEVYVDGVLHSSDVVNVTVNAAPVGIDPDYQAVLDYATANSIPLPDTTQQTEDNNEIIAYKATGSWATDDVYLKFEGTASSAFKRICWKRKVQIGVSATGLTWAADGVEGNGTTGYLDTLISPATCTHFTQNNAGIIFKSSKNPIETKSVFGVRDMATGTGVAILPNRGTGGSQFWNINQDLVAAAPTVQLQRSVIGLNGLYRTNSDTVEVKLTHTDGTVGGASATGNPSTALIAFNFFLLAQNQSGTPAQFSTEKLARVIIGANKSALHASINSVIN